VSAMGLPPDVPVMVNVCDVSLSWFVSDRYVACSSCGSASGCFCMCASNVVVIGGR